MSHPVLPTVDHWLTLPNEQAWWWWWNGEDLAIPHIVQVKASHAFNPPRHFIAYPDSRWCDMVGGFWCKIPYPDVPCRTEQTRLRSLPTSLFGVTQEDVQFLRDVHPWYGFCPRTESCGGCGECDPLHERYDSIVARLAAVIATPYPFVPPGPAGA